MRQCTTMTENKCCASMACGWCVTQTKKKKRKQEKKKKEKNRNKKKKNQQNRKRTKREKEKEKKEKNKGLRHDQQPMTICDFGMTPVTSSSLVPTSTSNESHARSDELRARRASRSFQICNSRSRSTEDRQPPCSASTTARSRGKGLNSAPPPCLPCFCSVSCATICA